MAAFRPGFDRLELAVDRDPDRLECSRRYVDVARPGGSGYRAGHQVGEVLRRPQRFSLTLLDDSLSDPGGPALLAVVHQDAPQLAGRFLVHEICGGPRFAAVESHVERSLPLEAEAPLGFVQLVGGKTEVEDHSVDRRQSLGDLVESIEIGVRQGHYDIRRHRLPAKTLDGFGVPVDSQQGPSRSQALDQRPRVSAAAQRGVNERLPGGWSKACY